MQNLFLKSVYKMNLIYQTLTTENDTTIMKIIVRELRTETGNNFNFRDHRKIVFEKSVSFYKPDCQIGFICKRGFNLISFF